MTELPAGYVQVQGTNRSPAPGATRVGSAEPAEQMSVSIRLRRRPGAPALPDPVTLPPDGGLTREEFAATYGADPADIERVEEFGREHGLTVEEASVPRRTVRLGGTVAQMGDAFGVDLGRYEVGETSYRGREGHVHVPEDLAPLVEGVFGLDNRRQARPLFQVAADPAQVVAPLTPPQVARLYDFPLGASAAGQCIGLFEFGGGYHPADISSWFSGHQLSAPPLVSVGVDGGTNSPGSGDDLEVILDIDVSGSVASGAKIAVYFAPWTEQGWVDIVTTAVHDAVNRPSVLSISWGWPEFQTADGLTWTAAAMAAVSQTFAEAAALGVTVLAASGDQGSQCQIADDHAHVIYPTSDPNVTSCGGTEIENVSGFGSFTEVLWNDNGASGGGISDNFVPPSWQASAGVPASVNNSAHHGRGVPDVAGNADPNSGYNLILNGSQVGPVGGTSAVAPLYAGLVALINARLNRPVGYLNPALYGKAEAMGVFRDITMSGTNGFGGSPGYPVKIGWDATTGLGSINGTKLLCALRDLTTRSDLALTGVSGWATIPVAFADGDGTWTVTNDAAGSFPAWATTPGVRVVTGDFAGNGRTDVALTGAAGWATIPVAFANGDGTWTVTNDAAGSFPAWATTPGVVLVKGDFAGNGRTGLALTGAAGWATIPVAFANGDGTWTVTNEPAGSFPAWATTPGVKVVTGDFAGNGRTGVALTGVSGWATIPVAFANGDGTWTVTNDPAGSFPAWASTPGVRVLTGDFAGNGRTGVALTGVSGWETIPVAFANGDGTWTVTNEPAGDFAAWATTPGVEIVTGDFAGNGRTAIALTGVSGWETIPVAFANGDGTWTVTNAPAGDFPGWASTPGAGAYRI